MTARVLPSVVGLVLLGLAATASAQISHVGETYCVGGYEGIAPHVVAACAKLEIQKQHQRWHFHNYVTDGTSCFICYDEEDATCQSVFLVRNPSYQQVNVYDCARKGAMHGSDQIISHVIDGQEVAESPAPSPVQLEAKVERISPGPYTAGDSISMVGAVHDASGGLRQVTGGTFRVTDSNGAVTDIPGKVQKDHSVEATYTLPPVKGLRVEFIPSLGVLGKNEVLRSLASEAQSLQVEVCGLRAKVVAPTDREALASGQRVSLRAALFDAAGTTPLAALPPGVSLQYQVQVDGEPAQTLPADAALEAVWTPPASPKSRRVRISASGRAGDRVICPAGETSVDVSDLGLAFDTRGLPATCYVGMPCSGTLLLQRPNPGPGRARVDALLGGGGTQVRVVDTGTVLYQGAPRPDDRYAFEATYTEEKSAHWSFVVISPQGDEVAKVGHDVNVRRPLQVTLPPELDFGTVPAGTPLKAACKRLDFSHSQAVEEHQWRLQAQGLEGCQARPVVLYTSSRGYVEQRSLENVFEIEAFDPRTRWVDICLDVPRCAGDVSPDGATLRVEPRTPEFAASQTRTLRLRWRVVERFPLECHSGWLWPVLGGLGSVVLLAGFTRPARFPPGAAVRVAGSEKGIRQAAAILLRGCPGSAPGFFRDARLGLHGDGNLTGRVRGAAVVLRAVKGGGVVLSPGSGAVERQDRRTLKWEPVEDLASGYPPAPGTLYRAGGTFFQVEN